MEPLEENPKPSLLTEQEQQEPQLQESKLTFIRQFSVTKIDEDVNESSPVKSPVKTTVKVWEHEENKQFDKKLRKTKHIPFSIDILKSKMVDASAKETRDGVFRRFFAKISPTENETAEEELSKEFHRDDFRRMNIFGQFNLGFIIAGKGDDLFIVDQHATDEKFNFERLQVSTIGIRLKGVRTKRRISPKVLNI